jgi:hypothetical protein
MVSAQMKIEEVYDRPLKDTIQKIPESAPGDEPQSCAI